MAKGYISDVDGSEKVMDVPDAEVHINLDQLPPMQGERLAVLLHENGVGDLDDVMVEEIEYSLQKGEEYSNELPIAFLHVDLQNLIMILNEAGIADIPTGVETKDISKTESNEDT